MNNLNAQEHFEPLIRDLIEAYGINKDIKLDLNIVPINFAMETLIPLGLIINELISNSLKYAFSDKDDGVITIHLKALNKVNSYELIIGDNGIGINNSSIELHPNQIGTKLIHSFVKQLNGKIKIMDHPGTFYQIHFEGKN